KPSETTPNNFIGRCREKSLLICIGFNFFQLLSVASPKTVVYVTMDWRPLKCMGLRICRRSSRCRGFAPLGLSRSQNYDFDTIPAINIMISDTYDTMPQIRYDTTNTIRYHKYNTIPQIRYDTTNTIRYHKYDTILAYLSIIVINKTSVRFPFLPACSCPAFILVLAH